MNMINTKPVTNRCKRGHYLMIIAVHINNKNRVFQFYFNFNFIMLKFLQFA